MRNLIAGIIVAVILATSTLVAKDLSIAGCTADSKRAVLVLDLVDTASSNIVAEINAAFTKTARSLPADVLLSEVGFHAFINNLTQENYNAINGIYGPPVIDGTCKVA